MRKRNSVFVLITVLILLAGVGSIVTANLLLKDIRSEKPLEAFGEALLIAGFLSLTVDRYAKWKLLREMSKDVSQFLIGYQLPEKAQDKIKELMGCKIIRQNLDIHWKIQTGQDPAKVRVTVNFSFDLINITGEEQPYQQFLLVEKQDNPVIEEVECCSSEKADSYRYAGQGISHDKVDEPGVIEALGKKLTIKPNKDGHGPTYRVGARYSMTLPQDYSDVFAFGAPTLKVTITDDVPPGFEFHAPDADLSMTNRWEYNKFFLPNQHVRVRWRKSVQPKGSATSKPPSIGTAD